MTSYGSLGDQSNSGSAHSSPLYHDHSPSVVLAGKAFGLVTVVMVIIAVIFSILEVSRNWSFSLLAVNLVISSVVTSFLVFWYRKGILAPDKMWFMFVIASILVFQCLSTIIYVTTHKTYVDGKKFIPAFTPVLAGKAFGLVTVVMVIIAVIFSILEVSRNWSFSLLAVNLVISSVVTSFLVFWYRKGILAPDKMWFMFVIASILVFQCLSTIIYVTTHKTYVDGKKFIPAFTPVTPVTIKTKPSHIEVTQGDMQYLQEPHG